MERGKLIALYGVNNTGKTTQAHMLVGRLKGAGKPAAYLKYPLYELSPSGPLINGYLRSNNPHALTPREFQIIQILNRTQYDVVLRSRLESGEWVVVEDYIGTGVAWGVGARVSETLLTTLNNHLMREDLSVLLDGERFLEAKEGGHLHENDDALAARVRSAHTSLAEKLGWSIVHANQPCEDVHEAIWRRVDSLLYRASD